MSFQRETRPVLAKKTTKAQPIQRSPLLWWGPQFHFSNRLNTWENEPEMEFSRGHPPPPIPLRGWGYSKRVQLANPLGCIPQASTDISSLRVRAQPKSMTLVSTLSLRYKPSCARKRKKTLGLFLVFLRMHVLLKKREQMLGWYVGAHVPAPGSQQLLLPMSKLSSTETSSSVFFFGTPLQRQRAAMTPNHITDFLSVTDTPSSYMLYVPMFSFQQSAFSGEMREGRCVFVQEGSKKALKQP